MRARNVGLLGLFGLLVSTASCTASLELDRFRKQEAQSIDALNVTHFDFRFGARNMQSHIDETLEIRLVDKGNNLQGKAVYVDVVNPDFTIDFPKFIPKANAPYRIDFWADHNRSGKYDGIEGGINDKDHAWRRVLADPMPEDVRFAEGRYELSFLHDTAFVDIHTDLEGNPIPGTDTLLPFKLQVLGAAPYAGKMLEVRVVERGSGRLVAVHRIGRALESYAAEVTGVLDEETPYEISAFVDLDGDEKYTPGDPSWRLELLSNETGVTADLDVSSAPQTPLGDPK